MNDIGSTAFASQVHSFADMQQFTSLRAEARENPDATKSEVAAQFESIFVQMMMTSMREASVPLESGLFSSNQSKMYQKMMDQQLSIDISARGGLGLAELIEKQMGSYSDLSPEKEAETVIQDELQVDIRG